MLQLFSGLSYLNRYNRIIVLGYGLSLLRYLVEYTYSDGFQLWQQCALVQSISSTTVLVTIKRLENHCAGIFLEKYALQLQQFGNSSATITTTACWCYDCYRRGSSLIVACFDCFSYFLCLFVNWDLTMLPCYCFMLVYQAKAPSH